MSTTLLLKLERMPQRAQEVDPLKALLALERKRAADPAWQARRALREKQDRQESIRQLRSCLAMLAAITAFGWFGLFGVDRLAWNALGLVFQALLTALNWYFEILYSCGLLGGTLIFVACLVALPGILLLIEAKIGIHKMFAAFAFTTIPIIFPVLIVSVSLMRQSTT